MNPARQNTFLKSFNLSENHTKLFSLILVLALISGVVTGYFLSSTNPKKTNQKIAVTETQKAAQEDKKTFRDFADGKLIKKPTPKNPAEYTEGTHLLIREGKSPVALISSVVDLSLYENKNVKVLGETQSALKEGWLMDVGKVEEK